MNSSLDALIYHAHRQARKGLEKDGKVPLFAAVLDDGVPTYLNIHLGAELAGPKSVGANAEVMRASIRAHGTTGALFCVPVRVPADDGTEWDGYRLHVDHIDDECAYLIVVRYVIDEASNLHLDKPVSGETSDRILERP